MGDLNIVFDHEHRKFGNAVSEQAIVDGWECLTKNNLNFIKSQGHFYSWYKVEEGVVKILSRTDHYIGSWSLMMLLSSI